MKGCHKSIVVKDLFEETLYFFKNVRSH